MGIDTQVDSMTKTVLVAAVAHTHKTMLKTKRGWNSLSMLLTVMVVSAKSHELIARTRGFMGSFVPQIESPSKEANAER